MTKMVGEEGPLNIPTMGLKDMIKQCPFVVR